MRLPARFALVLLCLLAACSTTRQLTIERGQPGEHLARVSGDKLKLRRMQGGVYSGMRPGYFTITGEDDWKAAGQKGSDMGSVPLGVDLVEHMFVVAVADSDGISAVSVDEVIDTSGALHVYVTERLRGAGCASSETEHPRAVVLAPRIVKPLRVHVEVTHGESCGDPPSATVQCRIAPTGSLGKTITASPGDTIDCQGTAEVRGAYPIIDRNMRIAQIPPGSTAKLAFSAATRGKMKIDSYGRYTVTLEATDDGGRKGHGVAHVDVMPPSDGKVYLEQTWGGFDASDELSTFPRVALRLTEAKSSGKGVPVRTCSVDGAATIPGCSIKAGGGISNAVLDGKSRRFRVSVRYTDERVAKGPHVCLRAYRNAKKTFELCDDERRAAESIWTVGIFDVGKGALAEPESDADAGAPPAGDAGSEKPGGKPARKR